MRLGRERFGEESAKLSLLWWRHERTAQHVILETRRAHAHTVKESGGDRRASSACGAYRVV